MYYRGTIAALRSEIKRMQPRTRAEYSELRMGEVASLSYLLWMCNEVEKMDTVSDDQAEKAARWIGWILAHAELNGLWNNEQSRDLVRSDRRQGLDKPFHPM